MSTSIDSLLAQASQLSEIERLNLAMRLLETTSQPQLSISLDDPNLVEEFDRRYAERDQGIAWSDLKAQDP